MCEGLTQLEKSVLDNERFWFKSHKTHSQSIQALGLSKMRYFLILSDLLDRPEAWKYSPQLVDRLKRLRYKRLFEKSGRSLTEF